MLGLLLFAPQAARGGEIAVQGGYGALGNPSPFAKFSLSFGKRLVFDVNGGIVFANAEKLHFVGLSPIFSTFSVSEKVKDVKIPKGNNLYSVGLEVRMLVREFDKMHNAYLGVGVDWLPQLETPYPGVKVVTGYQLSVLKTRNLVMRFGAEYYVYGIVPANALALTSSVGYRF